MNLTSTSVYVKITTHDLPEAFRVSYSISPTINGTPEKTIEKLNKVAKKRGVNATYELSTKDVYWAYRERA